jgi:hypothetical protein
VNYFVISHIDDGYGEIVYIIVADVQVGIAKQRPARAWKCLFVGQLQAVAFRKEVTRVHLPKRGLPLDEVAHCTHYDFGMYEVV